MKNQLFSLFGICLLSCALAAGSLAASETKDTRPRGLLVEVQVFSGRPNPVFLIENPDEIREVMGLLKNRPEHPTLRAGARGSVIPSILGFRGFTLTNTSAIEPDILFAELGKQEVRLERKAKSSDGAVTSEFLQDEGKAIQLKLLELIKTHRFIDARLVEMIEHAK